MTTYFNTPEAAKFVGCCVGTIHRYTKEGRLKAVSEKEKTNVPNFDPKYNYFTLESLEYVKKFRENPELYRRKRPKMELTEAICPRCGKKHKTKRNWSGTGTPRFYCPNCLTLIQGE
jgi:hypothetical protein